MLEESVKVVTDRTFLESMYHRLVPLGTQLSKEGKDASLVHAERKERLSYHLKSNLKLRLDDLIDGEG